MAMSVPSLVLLLVLSGSYGFMSERLLGEYRLANMNRLQCHRLCWYTSSCAAYSISSKVTPDGINCRLFDDHRKASDVPPGWVTKLVDNRGVHNGCKERTCSKSNVCVPMSVTTRSSAATSNQHACLRPPVAGPTTPSTTTSTTTTTTRETTGLEKEGPTTTTTTTTTTVEAEPPGEAVVTEAPIKEPPPTTEPTTPVIEPRTGATTATPPTSNSATGSTTDPTTEPTTEASQTTAATTTAARCGVPALPPNAFYRFQSISQGAVADLVCSSGYVPAPRNSSTAITCLPSGQWSEPAAVCQQAEFSSPGVPFMARLPWSMWLGWEACIRGTFLGGGQMVVNLLSDKENYPIMLVQLYKDVTLQLAFRDLYGEYSQSLTFSRRVNFDWDRLENVEGMPLVAGQTFSLTLRLVAAGVECQLHGTTFTASLPWEGRLDMMGVVYLQVDKLVALEHVNLVSTGMCEHIP